MNRVQVILNDDIKAQLEKKASEMGISMSAYVRILIVKSLKEKEDE